MKKRTLALLCAVTMVIGIAIGGTVAWLVATPTTVTNTFTTSNVAIDLYETASADDTTHLTSRELTMVPGVELFKNPTVKVNADSLACYLFVKVTEKNNSLTKDGEPFAPVVWSIEDTDPAWNDITNDVSGLAENEHLYYIAVDAATAKTGATYQILKENQVTIDSRVTKQNMDDWQKSPNTRPELNFTAYAIQSDYLKDSNGADLTVDDIAAIWNLAKTETTPSTP